MGLFKKSKKKVKEPKQLEPKIVYLLDGQIKKRQKEIENYQKIRSCINKFTTKYRSALTSNAYIGSDNSISLYLTEKYYNKYPEGFFLFAEQLGLDIEPHCSSGYSSSMQRSITLRAK